jgi:hypothetical protein
MDRVLDLLQKKNHYLEKFLLISEAELINFESGDFNNLQEFYDCRDKILNIVKHIEEELEKTSNQYAGTNELSADIKNKIENEFGKKDRVVSQILALDLKIISCVENEKSAIIKELQDLSRGKKGLEGYRAPNEANHRLNEEV